MKNRKSKQYWNLAEVLFDEFYYDMGYAKAKFKDQADHIKNHYYDRAKYIYYVMMYTCTGQPSETQ